MRVFTVHKPTHVWRDEKDRVIAKGMLRGHAVILNRVDFNGNVLGKEWAVGMCGDHLTGYGAGVGADENARREHMAAAWRYTFGADVPPPASCEYVLGR